MLSRPRHLFVIFGINFAVLIFCFLVLEIGFRVQIAFKDKSPEKELQKTLLNDPPPIVTDCANQQKQASFSDIVQPSAYPGIVYELKPNIETCFYNTPVIINAQGLRAPKNYVNPKPDNVYRILILGDSQAFGQGVLYEEHFGYLLEEQLTQIFPDKKVEVINTAVPGYNTAMEAAFLKTYGLRYDPDCILILFVGNDFGLPWLMLKERDVLTFYKSYFLDSILDRYRFHSSEEDWFEIPKKPFRSFVSWSELYRVPRKYRYMVGVSGYKRALESIMVSAGKLNIPVINLFDGDEISVVQLKKLGIQVPEFTFPSGEEYWLSVQDRHLNPAGHQEIAKSVLKIFAQMKQENIL